MNSSQMEYGRNQNFSFEYSEVMNLAARMGRSVTRLFRPIPERGALPIMAYTGRLRPKGEPFSGFRYTKRVGIMRYIKG